MREPGEGLRVECLSARSAGGERILGCVDFEAKPGEIVLVAGKSGSGKTTLLRILAGLAGLYGLEVEGSATCSSRDLAGGGGLELAAYVPQEPWYSLASPYVAVELAQLGLGPGEAGEQLARVGLRGKLYSSTLSLSAGQAERLSLLVAVLANRRLILVDEVSSYLDTAERLRARSLLVELASQGRIVLVVDHYLGLWSKVASKVVVLENGRSRVYGSPEETPLYRAFLGLHEKKWKPPVRGGRVLLRASNLWYRYPDTSWVVRGVSLEAGAGDIVWLRGPSGAGKSTLLKLLAGIYRPSRGRVERRAPAQYVPENPLLYLTEPTVGEELGGAAWLAERLGLDPSKPIGVLSSGERRRLAIGSAYLHSALEGEGEALLFLDEPTVGLDPWSAEKVLSILGELAGKGAGIVVASHAPEIGLAATKTLEVA